MQGQNSSPLWWKVMDKVTVEFSYILLPLKVPCASHFIKFRLFSISEPWYLLSAKQRCECLCHRIWVWILLDILLLEYGRHIMHLTFLPRLTIDILCQGEPLQQPGHGGPQLIYLRLDLLILLFHVAHPPRREMRKAIMHELTSLCWLMVVLTLLLLDKSQTVVHIKTVTTIIQTPRSSNLGRAKM